MKTLFFTLTVLLTTLTAFAGDGNRSPIANGDVRASGMYFTTAPNDSKWSNQTEWAFTKAKYANFSGETFITLTAYHKEVEIALDYAVKVNKGELKMIVVNSRDEVVFEKTFTANEASQVKLTLEVYEEYKVKFIGKQTKGSYVCQWNTEKTNSNL